MKGINSSSFGQYLLVTTDIKSNWMINEGNEVNNDEKVFTLIVNNLKDWYQ